MLAGAVAGFVGLAGFVVVHVLFIRFIPGLLIEGPIPAVLAGVAAGYGYHHLRDRLPRGFAGGAAYGALVWVPAAVALLIAAAVGPLGFQTVVAIAQDLTGVAAALGVAALLGWRLAGRRGAKAMVVGAFFGTLLVGGTLLAMGLMGRPLALLAGLLAIDVVAGLALVAVRARLATRQPS